MLTIYSRPWLDCFPSLRICLFFSFFFFFVVALHSNYWEKMSPVIFTLSSDPLIKEAFFVFLFFFSYSSSNLRLYSIPCCGWLFSSSSICTSPFKKKKRTEEREGSLLPIWREGVWVLYFHCHFLIGWVSQIKIKKNGKEKKTHEKPRNDSQIAMARDAEDSMAAKSIRPCALFT